MSSQRRSNLMRRFEEGRQKAMELELESQPRSLPRVGEVVVHYSTM